MSHKPSLLHESSKRSELPIKCLVIWFTLIPILSSLVGSNARAAMSVTLAWDRNPEPDVNCYIIYYGTNSRAYPYSTNVGNVTCATVHGLDPCTTYFFALTAMNTSGLESDFSIEVTNGFLLCVRLEVSHSTNVNGPWTILYSTSIPRSKPGGFFKTVMTPLWPSAIAPTEYCSNGVSYPIPVDTNEVVSAPPAPPGIPTNELRSTARRLPYRGTAPFITATNQ